MKKIVLYIVSIIFILTPNLFSRTFTDKTFIRPRSHLYNMPMELSQATTKILKKKSKWGARFEFTGFYQESTNKRNIGEYFGYWAKDAAQIRDFVSVIETNATNGVGNTIGLLSDDINSSYLISNPREENQNALSGSLRFKPYQESYGLRIDYNQNLKNFFLRADAPIVSVSHSLDLSEIATLTKKSLVGDTVNGIVSILDFFQGNINDNGAGHYNRQLALQYAKFMNRKSASGVADINVALGYNIVNSRKNRVGLAIATTIPTGNKPNGKYLFEPLYGNSSHWGLGGIFETKLCLWEGEKDKYTGREKDSIIFLLNFDVRYLFESSEVRTLGLLNDKGEHVRFGHYYLAGKSGDFPVFPLANILTRNVKVEPGVQTETLIGLAFNSGKFGINIGYNLYTREGERTYLKGVWDATSYAVANPGDPAVGGSNGYETVAGTPNYGGPFNPTSVYHYDVNTIAGPIKESNLDLSTVRTPTQITNKAYFTLGYHFDTWRFPLLLQAGTSYEFATCNTALSEYAIWGKIGVSF